MCTFCKNLLTGDDYKAIVYDETEDEIIFSDVSVGIVGKNSFPVLEVTVNLMNKPILSNYTSITFCPMCGRNLRKVIKEMANHDKN